MIELRMASLRHEQNYVLREATVAFQPGCLTAIIGPNGAGKSTLLKVASGEWKPSDGEALIGNRAIAAMPANELAAIRAVVAQSSSLNFPFSVLDVIALGASVPGFGMRRPAEALDALHLVGLSGFQNRIYTQLSGGERQRVHIARALCQIEAAKRPPDIAPSLLLDEPTSNLDPAHQTLVMSILRGRADRGWAIAIVLHDLNLTAAWADHVVLMDGGRVLACGKPVEVLTEAGLSCAYGCPMGVNTLPKDGRVFVLPHHMRASHSRQQESVGHAPRSSAIDAVIKHPGSDSAEA